MNEVIRVNFPDRVRPPPRSSYEAFCAARRLMLDALNAWAKEHPNDADVVEEIEGTNNAMRAAWWLK